MIWDKLQCENAWWPLNIEKTKQSYINSLLSILTRPRRDSGQNAFITILILILPQVYNILELAPKVKLMPITDVLYNEQIKGLSAHKLLAAAYPVEAKTGKFFYPAT